MKKIENWLSKVSNAFAQNTALSIISSSFMMIMTLTIIGSFASLLKGLNFGGYQAWLQSTIIFNLLGSVYQFTIGFLAIYVVFGIGYQYATKKGLKKQAITIGLVSLLVFMIITPYDAATGTLSTMWYGATGLFMAMIVGFVVGWVFQMCQKYNIEIKLPEQVPPTIGRQFSAMIPALFAVILAMVVAGVFSMTSMGNAQDALYSIVRIPLGLLSTNIFGLWIFMVFVYLMWFFGIHGGLAVMPIMMVLFMSLQMENLAAYQAGLPLPNMVTGSSLSVGSGAISMIVAMLLFGKSAANKSITKLAIIPALFGVDEPAYFGYPMIMNPIFFIPWVILVPSLTVFGTYALQSFGLLGYFTGATAGGFVPFFVTNLTGYGVSGFIWGCVFFVLAVLIYLPFVRIYDKQCFDKENSVENKETV